MNTQIIWMIIIKLLKTIIQESLIVFDDMIVDMLSSKKINPRVTEVFIRVRKLNISLVLLQNLILLFQKILD